MQFEFGAAQHQQAPDVKSFELYWRPETLFTRTMVNISLLSITETMKGFVHTVRLRKSNNTTLPPELFKSLVGDVITNVIIGATEVLPANQRRRFRIAKVTSPDRVVLEPTPTTITNQTYELVQDPHNRFGWTKLEQPSIGWREPITGILNTIETALRVKVVRVSRPSLRPDPFSLVPPASRPRQFPNVPPAQPVIEVEINRVLTEPDVFAEGTATKTGWPNAVTLVYVVTNPTAGVTLLALPADTPIAVGDSLDLFPPPAMSETVRLLVIGGTVDIARLNNPGGEIAFESGTGGSLTTSIMRVISSAANGSGVYELMVRADSAATITKLRPNQTRIRYYAPFTTSLSMSFSEVSGQPIVVRTPTTTGYSDGFIAASAIDNGNNEGPLSAPSQFSLILPGPSGTPSRPYPCGMDVLAPAGYASPPNRAGRATTCVTWDTNHLSPSEGLRFEVARAMDNTILTTHLRDWQMGKVRLPATVSVTAGPSMSGVVVSVDTSDPNGLINALFIPSSPVLDPDSFRKGRLIKNDRYFQVTLLKTLASGPQILLRGQLPPESILGQVTIEGPPDYSSVAADVASLQELALDVPDSFALVTGVPIDANRFTDDVAGVGRNRFFYRVRAVDAAENRSGWSPISAPFYQVDTTPPAPPHNISALSGERRVTLRWQHNEPSLARFAIHRSLQGDSLMNLLGRAPELVMPIDEGSPTTTFELQDEPLEGLRPDETYFYRLIALKRVQYGPSAEDFLEIPSVPSPPLQIRAIDTFPPKPPTWAAAEWWNPNTNLVADSSTAAPVVRLSWFTPLREAKCILYRRLANKSLWKAVTGSLTSSSTTDPFLYSFIDPDIDPSQTYEYHVELTNRLGRKNTEFLVMQLPKLR